MHTRNRICSVVAMAAALLMVLAGTAMADNLQDDVVASGNGTFAAGGSTTVAYRIVANGSDGCNVDSSNTATMQVNAPAGLSANPSSLTFSSCGTSQSVVYSTSTPGTYDLAPTITGGKDRNNGWNLSPATSSLTVTAVTAPSDTAAPTDVSISINGGDWTNDRNVSLALSATDNVGVTRYRLAETQAELETASDVAVSPAAATFSASDVSFTLSDSDGAGKAVWLRVFDAAGNSADASDTIGLDRVAPTSVVTGVAGPYLLGTEPTPVCQATDSLSGVASDGTATTIGGSGVGQKSVTCNGAVDNAGNVQAVASATVTYRVLYDFLGFDRPVDNNLLNRAKAGQSIPLKWRLLDASGNPVTNLGSVKVTVASLSCSLGTTVDDVEEYAAGSSGLQNLGDGYYQFNWKTPANYANSCKTMHLDLGEDVTHTAKFQFTK